MYRRVPAIESLRHYSFVALRADFLAGLTVASVAVPQAMAYAIAAGVPAAHGLYTAIVMTAVGALFDSSKQLINGPTNAVSIALLSAISFVAGRADPLEATVLVAFLVGAIQLGISFLRLGDLTRYISHSVIVGFTAGASVLLVLDQTKNLLGLRAAGAAHDHFLVRFWETLVHGGGVHGLTLAFGLGSIAAILLLRWFKARVDWPLLPEFLVVIIAAAALTAIFRFDEAGLAVVGDIPAKLPSPQWPVWDFHLMRELSSSALAIAVLGLLEAIAMAKAIAAKTGQKLDLNQQCLSEGFANFAASFFQCMPGSGSLTRSAVNQQAGARTQWSGVVSALAIALIMMLFAPYARFIPRSALAGLLMVTAMRMVNPHDLRYHLRASRFDAAIVIVTAVSAIAISIEFCILIGVFLSFMLTVPRTGQMLLTEFVIAPNGLIHERLASDRACDRLMIFGLEGEMYFGSSVSLEQHLEAIEARITPETRVVVLRVKRARNPDAVGMAILDRWTDRVRARGVDVVLCGVRLGMHECMTRCGLAAKLGEENVFLEQPVRQTSTMLAVRHAYERIRDRCATCPRREIVALERGLTYQI